MSFGNCEGPDTAATDEIIQQLAQAGIAVVAAADDWGNTCNGGNVGAAFPASDPNVIAVGGTETQPPATLTNPAVWNDCATSGFSQCAGGGGVSGNPTLGFAGFPIPSYQQGLAGIASTQFRNVPDVSLPASSTSLYMNGTWWDAWGTSWGAPQMAALMAEVYEYCGAPLSPPVEIPYYVYAHNPSAFIDVTTGNDQYKGTSPFYTAGAGYDDASGLGIPYGMQFAQTICPNRVPAASLRRRGMAALIATHLPAQAYTTNATPPVRGLTDLGERNANDIVRMQIVLRSTPTVASDERGVVGLLRDAGLTVTKTFPNHLVIDAQGRTALLERLFSTHVHNVSQPGFGVHYLPSSPITVPASLAPYVEGINLDNVVTYRARTRVTR
jgi:subtilase family serine protease